MSNLLNQSEDYQQNRGSISPLIKSSLDKNQLKLQKQKQNSLATFTNNNSQYLSGYSSNSKQAYNLSSQNLYNKTSCYSISSTQPNQKQQAQNITYENNVIKKMDGRTNSQHQIPCNIQNVVNLSGYQSSLNMQNVDNSKSTDTSPQFRSVNGITNVSNSNLFTQINLQQKNQQHQQMNSSSLIQSQLNASGNNFLSQSNQINGNTKQYFNSFANKTLPQSITQQSVMSPGFYQYEKPKDPYLQIAPQSSNSFSLQKPKSANLGNYSQQQLQQQIYSSPLKNKSGGLEIFDKNTNQASKITQILNNHGRNSQVLESNSNLIRTKNNSLQIQYVSKDSSYQKQQQLQNDIYQNLKFFEQKKSSNNDKNQSNNLNNTKYHYHININSSDNPVTSSNVTEDEGAKLYTIDSGSIKSQNQKNSINNNSNNNQNNIQYQQDDQAKIIELEKENNELKERIKSLEHREKLREAQIELQICQAREQYNIQNEKNLKKQMEEHLLKEQQIKKEFEWKLNQSACNNEVLQLLHSLMDQKEEMMKQMKQIQEKFSESELKIDDKQQNIDLKLEQSPSSIDNLIQRSQNSQNNIANGTFKKITLQSVNLSQSANPLNMQDFINNQVTKMEAETINEEDDCSTGTNQDTMRNVQKRKNYQLKKEGSKSTNDEIMTNSIGFQTIEKNEKCFNDEFISNSPSPMSKKKSLRNSSLLISSESRIEELERLIGAKNHEIQILKQKLYQIKDYLIINLTKFQRLNIPNDLIDLDIQPMKRRKSFSSSSDLHSLGTLNNARKQIQNSIMEWSYSLDCSGSVERLIEDGWKIQEMHCKANLHELEQVIGVLGMPKSGKTTLINGLMKGSLQTVEELKKTTYFDPKLNIILDENIAIFEYSYMQPIQIDNQQQISQSSITDLAQQKQFSTMIEEQIAKTNRRDFFWIDFFIKNTQTLIIVFDKFTQEEQKMLSEILNRIENEESLVVKELILIHNYYSKGLNSAQELQTYFGQSLQHIDANFKQKSMVELKVYKTSLIQKNTQSKKYIQITHILNGNLFEPFADKYQHAMLQYCMNRLSEIQNQKKFLPSFEQFLKNNISNYFSQNYNIDSFQAIQPQADINAFRNYYLDFDEQNSSITFKLKHQQ
ncbi:50S ribosome-binding GTPase (macronuclear) [Tetrahymena thermophila SB210]|uniref:50S ribosome-binding GTPase n=1 Tax=Tetrahymena thermophila (strain SB210) TaxID=312017 RepID=Q238U6_TETTS|nr:50S ribosome-binding GTPase [Tetrahymena thermophila SB210]EAR93124.1 50S ribosome-binding GTPase [Tetrahymena thermophila SB210]|eukprot:XP_001013369.1 50S ribosome-binding GTPase [Tetrahymena thermophila SB210]